MALPKQRGLGLAESIENAVSDVEQPGGKREKERLGKRQVKMHGADEEPGPESSDTWRIQTEQMPPVRKVVDTSCQSSVYVRLSWMHFGALEDSRLARESRTVSRQPFQSSPVDRLRAGSSGLDWPFLGGSQVSKSETWGTLRVSRSESVWAAKGRTFLTIAFPAAGLADLGWKCAP
jgi:hypothetical protein